MLRLSLFAVALTTACATTETPVDELAGESADDGEAGKGDSADAFDFFSVELDVKGTWQVSRPNRATTICGRGSQGARCGVNGIDWSQTALPASVANGYEESLRKGEQLILRGAIAPHPADQGSVFAVTEVWLPRSETGVADGVAVLVKDNGVRCFRAPCPSMTEFRINSNRFIAITDLDLAASGADEQAIEIGARALFEDGVLVFGDRYYPQKDAKGRAANQFYTRVPVPQF